MATLSDPSIFSIGTTGISSNYENLKHRAKENAIHYGQQYAPRLTAQLTKDPNPKFAIWGPAFAYLILTVYIFVDLLQFVDIFSNDTQLLMGVSGIRFIVYLISGAMSVYSIYMGWRTVPISLIFQMIVVVISIITGIAVTITRSFIVFQQKKEEDRNWFSYVAVIVPIIQIFISSIGLYFLWQEYKTDEDSKAQVGMIGLTVGATVGITTAIVGLIKHSGVMGIFPN